jgi:hypothetical protein
MSFATHCLNPGHVRVVKFISTSAQDGTRNPLDPNGIPRATRRNGRLAHGNAVGSMCVEL